MTQFKDLIFVIIFLTKLTCTTRYYVLYIHSYRELYYVLMYSMTFLYMILFRLTQRLRNIYKWKEVNSIWGMFHRSGSVKHNMFGMSSLCQKNVLQTNYEITETICNVFRSLLYQSFFFASAGNSFQVLQNIGFCYQINFFALLYQMSGSSIQTLLSTFYSNRTNSIMYKKEITLYINVGLNIETVVSIIQIF